MMRTVWPSGLAALFLGLASAAGWAGSLAVESSIRPPPRPVGPVEERLVLASANLAFNRWIEGFRVRALAQGISASVFDRAFRGIRYNTDVIQRDRTQNEFTKTIWDYLDTAVSEDRVANGRRALERHRALLEEIEARYGVDKEVVLAIWGLESAYGGFRGSTPTVEALATLAFDGRRAEFFEAELVAALKILQSGDVAPEAMRGSWAGAMGHTQFMPSSYLVFAVDQGGDGRRDIWGDDPTDALASTAAYLARHGWRKGSPWGVEVRLPEGFDYGLTGERIKKSAADWAALGVRAVDGSVVPEHGAASILMPAGAHGAAFMIFPNFSVIETYNPADAYVIAVGHLADRIAGGPPIAASWPREDRALTLAERRELQERLTHAGFATGGVDGKVGPNTIAAVRAFQRSKGLIPDGYASLEVLRRLR
jgi:membrane-bound lytic murein transglycosylase B